VFCHESISHLAVFAEGAGGAHLIEAHEPRVTRHVSGHYCSQPASDPAWMRFGHRNAIPLENRSRPEEPYSAIKPQPRVDPLDCFKGSAALLTWKSKLCSSVQAGV